MDAVFCNRCGHRNPPASAFCSACGSVLDVPGDARTIVLTRPDPLQDAPGHDDDVHVDIGGIARGEALLVVRDGPDQGRRFVLSKDITTLGRNPENDISLDDITVSRRHASVHRRGSDFFIRDAGSLNGTYVNQRRVDDEQMSQGDEVQIGKFRMVFLEHPEDVR